MCQHMLTRAGTCCHGAAEREVTPWRQAHLLEQKEGLRNSLINCAAIILIRLYRAWCQILALLVCGGVKWSIVA